MNENIMNKVAEYYGMNPEDVTAADIEMWRQDTENDESDVTRPIAFTEDRSVKVATDSSGCIITQWDREMRAGGFGE